jgi:hypothetical protein
MHTTVGIPRGRTPVQLDEEPRAVMQRSAKCNSEVRGCARRSSRRSCLAVHGGVVLEIDRPHHVRRISGHWRDRRHPSPLARRPAMQAFLAPQQVDFTSRSPPGARRSRLARRRRRLRNLGGDARRSDRAGAAPRSDTRRPLGRRCALRRAKCRRQGISPVPIGCFRRRRGTSPGQLVDKLLSVFRGRVAGQGRQSGA